MQNYMVQKPTKSIINWARKLRLQRSENYLLPFIVTMANESVRWAFNIRDWNPTKDEILVASSYIQPEEKHRISQFIFQDDAKASLIGRLLMRKFIHLSTSIPYERIELGRDIYGKPYLLNFIVLPSFNVSHQGDYVVLAGSVRISVGVDVMKIEPPANKNIPDFFRLMNRQFSQQEWSTILSFPTEMEQIACFYRMWCLKESYVKNIGWGLSVPLDSVRFSVQTPLKKNEVVTDTKLYVSDDFKKYWAFEESLLDEKHAVVVSLLNPTRDPNYSPKPFTFLNYQDVIKEAVPRQQPDSPFSEDLLIKKVKEFKITD